MFSAPGLDHRMPDCLQRPPMTVLQPASTTPEQMKMFLTRIGFGSKVVITGDATQVDIPDGRSGLAGLQNLLGEIEGLQFVHLDATDVVRHRIVGDIVAAYEKDSERKNARVNKSHG